MSERTTDVVPTLAERRIRDALRGYPHAQLDIDTMLAAARADERYRTLESEADLIGNGTCCPECDAVANMMRDRALVPVEPSNTPGSPASEATE